MRKVGIYYAYWTREWNVDFFPFVKKVKALGFEILEINAGTVASMSRDQRERLRVEAEREGIGLTFGIGLPARYDVSSLDERVRSDAVKFMKQMIRAVHEIGGTMIGGTVHSYWPAVFPKELDSKQPILDQSVRSMLELIPLAEDLGVTLNVEVINRFEQFLINTCDEALQYVSRINSPNCGILLDTFHINIEEDSFGDTIRKAGGFLKSLHIGETNRKPPGMGRVPWIEIRSALDDIGYRGPLVMEPFVMPGGQVGRDIGVWRQVITSPDLDALAATSAEFVKETLR